MIMAFHLAGRLIETLAKGRSSQAIKRLLTLGAKTARRLRPSSSADRGSGHGALVGDGGRERQPPATRTNRFTRVAASQ